MSVLLRVGYDGTEFHGYAAQRPPPGAVGVRTVQGELERALGTLYKQTVATRAASRTDAGVHAHGQLVAFEPPPEIAIPTPGLVRGLNGRLPSDVAVLAAWHEGGADPVDVRRGNSGKHYRYRIRCTEVVDPLTDRYEWHLGRGLDIEAMRSAAARFLGTHDFGSFRAAACQASSTIRTITAVDIEPSTASAGPLGDPGRLDREPITGVVIDVHGEAFLMNMVRIMVGTLADVGLRRRDPGSIEELLARPDRSRAGLTAPARGLTLCEVKWNGAQRTSSSASS